MFRRKIILGLRVLQLMRKAGAERVVALNTAADLDQSESYIEQIFSALKSTGLVEAKRGPGGGYLLAKQNVDEDPLYCYMTLLDFTRAMYPDEDDNSVLADDFVSMTLDEVIET